MTFALAFIAPSFFTEASAEAQHTATVLLMLFALTAVVRNTCFMAVIGVLRAGGDTTYCMIAETLIIWLISVPLVMVGGLVFKWNIYVLYMLGNVSEVIKCVFFLLRVKSNKWLKFISVKNQPVENKA